MRKGLHEAQDALQEPRELSADLGLLQPRQHVEVERTAVHAVRLDVSQCLRIELHHARRDGDAHGVEDDLAVDVERQVVGVDELDAGRRAALPRDAVGLVGVDEARMRRHLRQRASKSVSVRVRGPAAAARRARRGRACDGWR